MWELEGVADGEVEGGVSLEVGVDEGPFFLVSSWVMGFHTHVETKQEVVEVESDTDAIGCGELLIELAELELSAGLVLVVANGPDVTGIDKGSHLYDPEEFCPEFDVGIESDVTALVDESGLRILGVVAARPQCSDAPASDAVGTAGIESFLER